MTEHDAHPAASITDRGYQHYGGVRLGLTHIVWTMVWAAMRWVMGLRRSGRAKVMPWLLTAVAYAPMLIILASTAAVSRSLPRTARPELEPYTGYYAFLALVIVVFASLAAADLLCADRRERVVSLYFVAPITRAHYIAAKLGALTILLLGLTALPALLLFAGLALLANDTGSYASHHLADIWRILLSGLLLSLFYGTIAATIAALTNRRVYATGGTLGVFLVSSVAAGIVSQAMHFPGHDDFALVDLPGLPILTVNWLFGQRVVPDLGAAYLYATLGITAVSLAFLMWQYTRIRD